MSGAEPARADRDRLQGPGPWAGRRIHFIGVGGAGMSAYARAARALGATVSGSDRAESSFARALRDEGVLEPQIGHDPANLPAGDDVEVVFSSAVAPSNPERAAALARGLALRSRAELLGELTALRRTIAVAGSHGKTTTSAMIATALRACGQDPGYLIGGTLLETGRNGDWGTGEWLVVEADESDHSMLSLATEIVVLTSVELDHHSEFGSLLELERDYRELLARAPLAVIRAAPELLALRPDEPVVAYDADSPARHGVRLELALPGEHNRLNAAAALEACVLAGADPATAAAALERFEGTGRRFERLGHTPAGALVIDDYAHHPTEVAATLAAATALEPRRLVAVFQPHLFSRTQQLAGAFGAALAGADDVVVLDIYPARERAEDFPGVSGRLVAAAAADAAGGRAVWWLPAFDDAEPVLRSLLASGDVCVVMGAGNSDALARRLL